ncbi:hypothetical protein RRG08_020842 [Elysia crispata]|uniref:Uncharacterized protein n=1 Tax=Elysia crispata TaxID=231223 RepID=A0AAE0XUT6_9GAST|nr:hypothetical protein RRG08_020842 [Elysia crispata]
MLKPGRPWLDVGNPQVKTSSYIGNNKNSVCITSRYIGNNKNSVCITSRYIGNNKNSVCITSRYIWFPSRAISRDGRDFNYLLLL